MFYRMPLVSFLSIPKRLSPYIIAEAGVNHNGRLDAALKLVDAAAAAGADAVKFQTFKTESLVTRTAEKAPYQKETTGKKGGQFEMLKALELDEKAHRALIARCAKKGIRFLSTPFDEESADLLQKLGVSWFKIPSGELTNAPFLKHVGAKRRPVILSTGMSTMAEVAAAVKMLLSSGTKQLALLHCVSSYPAPESESNLKAMLSLREKFSVPVGWSDHTPGVETAIAATALGAAVLEKHFTLDKSWDGPDHRMSLDPAELATYVRAVRTAAFSLGDGVKRPRPCELPVRAAARKSLVLTRDGKAGEKIGRGLLSCKRPGTGISPMELGRVLGKRLKRDVAADRPLQWGDLGGKGPKRAVS